MYRQVRVSRSERRNRPDEFPYVCTRCKTEQRFKTETCLQKHEDMKHDHMNYVHMKNGHTKRRTNRRRHDRHAVRRMNPDLYPEVCDNCVPQRRFKKPKDLGNHNRDVHSSLYVPKRTEIHERNNFSVTEDFNRMRLSYMPSTSYPARHSDTAESSFHAYSAISNCPPVSQVQEGRSRNQSRQSSFSFTKHNESSLFSPIVNKGLPVISSPLDQRRTFSDFNRYVADTIEPDTAYNDSCSAAVDRLVKYLQNNAPQELRPDDVIKAGSLGKGTAVKDRSDVDLVNLLADRRFNNISTVKQYLPCLLEKLSKYLREYGECQVTGKTPFAVKVKLSSRGYDIDVDILPTCNTLRHLGFVEKIYEEMRGKSPRDRDYYSASLAQLQIEFIKHRPSKLKSLIRVVKFWRKTAFEESASLSSRRLPSSYPLELITIATWEDAGRPMDFNLRKGFNVVLHALTNYHRLRKAWSDNYNPSSYPFPSPPYIMDPANPYNNVMTASNAWDEVAIRARKTMTTGYGDIIDSSWN